MKKKVLVAFSGGLDTSFCVKYLKEDKGFEVYTALVNTGGFSKDELSSVAEKRSNSARHPTKTSTSPRSFIARHCGT